MIWRIVQVPLNSWRWHSRVVLAAAGHNQLIALNPRAAGSLALTTIWMSYSLA